MTTALLQTTYFGPVQWYQKLYRYDRCIIEQYDSFHKQTYRNRCIIATANGLQALTVPIEHLPTANGQCVKDIRISDHNQWRRVHWNALSSAYSESPFFDYYTDDIRPFYEKKYTYLVDFNEAIRQTVCVLLDIHPDIVHSSQFIVHSSQFIVHSSQFIVHSSFCESKTLQANHKVQSSKFKVQSSKFKVQSSEDFRDVIDAKHPLPDPGFQSKPYWQVFQHKHGFQANLSILDLLFNMGPESIYYL